MNDLTLLAVFLGFGAVMYLMLQFKQEPRQSENLTLQHIPEQPMQVPRIQKKQKLSQSNNGDEALFGEFQKVTKTYVEREITDENRWVSRKTRIEYTEPRSPTYYRREILGQSIAKVRPESNILVRSRRAKEYQKLQAQSGTPLKATELATALLQNSGIKIMANEPKVVGEIIPTNLFGAAAPSPAKGITTTQPTTAFGGAPSNPSAPGGSLFAGAPGVPAQPSGPGAFGQATTQFVGAAAQVSGTSLFGQQAGQTATAAPGNSLFGNQPGQQPSTTPAPAAPGASLFGTQAGQQPGTTPAPGAPGTSLFPQQVVQQPNAAPAAPTNSLFGQSNPQQPGSTPAAIAPGASAFGQTGAQIPMVNPQATQIGGNITQPAATVPGSNPNLFGNQSTQPPGAPAANPLAPANPSLFPAASTPTPPVPSLVPAVSTPPPQKNSLFGNQASAPAPGGSLFGTSTGAAPASTNGSLFNKTVPPAPMKPGVPEMKKTVSFSDGLAQSGKVVSNPLFS